MATGNRLIITHVGWNVKRTEYYRNSPGPHADQKRKAKQIGNGILRAKLKEQLNPEID